MANTYVDYVGSDGTGTGPNAGKEFLFSFPYIKTSHVAVEINQGPAGGTNKWERTTDFTVETSPSTRVVLDSVPNSLWKIRVLRDSDANEGIVDFANGSVLTETELDNSYQHNRYLAEEAEEGKTGGALVKDETSGQFDADALRLENLADPDSDDDAVNKGYADNRYVDVAGDTMTGALDMGANKVTSSATPSSGNDLTNKTYTDATFVDVAGDTMSGELNMGSNKITNLADPTVDADAANKNYVDDTITTSLATGSPPPGVQLATAQIEDDAITYAKLQNVAANNVLLGNDNGTGVDVQELTATEARTLLNVEDGATADQTASEIKTAYESNLDTNAFTDAEKTKLTGIATNANNYSHPNHSGDVTSVGDGDITLNTVNSNIGSFTNANITVNGKGLVTAASSGSGGAAGTPNYSTGWQTSIGGTTVANAATITVTHNLGTTNVTWMMYANSSASDTGASSITGHDVFTSGRFGALVKNLTSNTITFELAANGYSTANGSGATITESFNGDYIKVIVSASATVAGDEYVSAQGTGTSTATTTTTDEIVGSVSLTLPSGKTWKWVKVVFSTELASQNGIEQVKVRETGGSFLSWVSSFNGRALKTTNSDDKSHPTFIFEGVPSTTGSNITIEVTGRKVSTHGVDVVASRELYAVGIAS